MTRATLRRKMRTITLSLIAVLVIALAAKLAEVGLISWPGTELKELGKATYEFLKDMAVVIVTIAAAYLAAILQRRSNFIESLEQEWRSIVRTKSELFTYCERENPDYDTYLDAFCSISEAIDSLRIVYRNVGETEGLVGLYPYVPLQDMRRALQTLDPSKRQNIGRDERKLVREAVLQCFYALRETFLEELDLEEPGRPLLVAASRRIKTSGATPDATLRQKWQDSLQRRQTGRPTEIDRLLLREWDREHDRNNRPSPSGNGPQGN